MSALIFAAVAAAWAVYLVPKALRHHEESAASRGIDQISDRARVLARRDAVSARSTALVAAGRRTGPPTEEAPDEDQAAATAAAGPPLGQVAPAARRTATARRAAQRRRRVLATLLLAAALVITLAGTGRIGWTWVVAPVALIALWLVACRLMVRGQRARRAAPVRKRRTTLADQQIAAEDEAARLQHASDEEVAAAHDAMDADTDQMPAVAAEPGTWTPVNVPLPTYVTKEPAHRTVRTIDLDSTGVWTSGRREIDSEIAREAEAKDRVVRSERDAMNDVSKRRASGS